jgi:hypothetical protein
MKILALVKDPNYSTTVNFDNVQYQLNILWNERSNSWYVDILTSQGIAIVSGMKICNAIDLFRLKYSEFPEGMHLVPILSNLDTSIKIKHDDLPSNLMLYYMDDAEHDALIEVL